MKILMAQTFHYYRGGDATSMFSLTRLLEERGHEVIHFAMEHPENLPCPTSGYFSPEIDFPALLEDFSLSSAWKVSRGSIYNREARSRIARLADDVKPDIAHFHNIHGHLTTSIIEPLRMRGIPVAWTVHDYRLVCPNTTFLSGGEICERCLPARYWNVVLHRCKKGSAAASLVAMLSAVWDRASNVPARVGRFIAPSEFLRGKLIEGGIPRGKIERIPNFVDVESYRADAEEGDYYLYFGRLSPEKGIGTLIEAAATACGGRLRIAGEGPMLEELKAKAFGECPGRVEFLGFVGGDDLRSLVERARFVVVPSQWYENLPYSVMESMAAGRPVVASAIGGIPEMVDDGVTGRLFPAGDAAALAGAIEELLADPGLRRSMGRAAREKAERLYAPGAHYDATMKIYNELLGRKSPGD